MKTAEKRRQVEGESRTRIVFDLEDELSADELERFEAAAKEKGVGLTEFFLNMTIRKPAEG